MLTPSEHCIVELLESSVLPPSPIFIILKKFWGREIAFSLPLNLTSASIFPLPPLVCLFSGRTAAGTAETQV